MLPKAVLFDYGMTLCTEPPINRTRGAELLLRHAAANPRHITSEVLLDWLDRVHGGLGYFVGEESRRDPDVLHQQAMEENFVAVLRYTLERLDLVLDVPLRRAEVLYWDACSPGSPAPGVQEVLSRLDSLEIPYGVVSNMCFAGDTLERRLFSCLPRANFRFILASSEYAFRKPHRMLFEMALHKLGLPAGQDVWFCGDHPVCDVEGAAGAGLRPFWVRLYNDFDRLTPPRAPCTHIAAWPEFLRILEQQSAKI